MDADAYLAITGRLKEIILPEIPKGATGKIQRTGLA
jgi:hypothetical protein